MGWGGGERARIESSVSREEGEREGVGPHWGVCLVGQGKEVGRKGGGR